MSNERRRHVRIAVDVPATIVIGDAEPVSGTIANFSERGIFMRTDLSPALQRPVHLQFILKPDHTLCKASGKVAWRGPHGVGVLFDEINDALQAFIQELGAADQSIKQEPKRELLERIMGEPDVEIA